MKTDIELIRSTQEIELEHRSGLAIRIVPNLYRHDTLGTTGALQWGGRYNIRQGFPNEFGALYAASDIETAESEALDKDRSTRHEKSYYLVLYNLLIADLCSQENQIQLGISQEELTQDGWKIDNKNRIISPTQLLGSTFYHNTQAQALLYLSAQRQSGYNLAIFPDKIIDNNSDNFYLKSRLFLYSAEEVGQDIFPIQL